jgi:hypothetical protein
MLSAQAPTKKLGITTVVLISLPWQKGMSQWCRLKPCRTRHKATSLSPVTFTSSTFNSTNGSPIGLVWTTSTLLVLTALFVNSNWTEPAPIGQPQLSLWETHVEKLSLAKFLLAALLQSMELRFVLTRGLKVQQLTTKSSIPRATSVDRLSMKARSS